jgi:hypothetical protein
MAGRNKKPKTGRFWFQVPLIIQPTRAGYHLNFISAGFLAQASLYSSGLPIRHKPGSGFFRISSAFTVAGQRRNCTALPVQRNKYDDKTGFKFRGITM